MIMVSTIERVHGQDKDLRDKLTALGIYDERTDSCTDARVAWALMYPSIQATTLFRSLS